MKRTPAGHAPRRNRWRWALTLLLGIVGLAGALVRSRRAAPPALDELAVRPAEPLTWQYHGNGVVHSHHRPGEGS